MFINYSIIYIPFTKSIWIYKYDKWLNIDINNNDQQITSKDLSYNTIGRVYCYLHLLLYHDHNNSTSSR